MRFSFAAVALATSMLAPTALGAPQGMRATVVAETPGTPTGLRVFEVELEAGGVLSDESFDLAPITPFPMPPVEDAQRIGNELWVVTNHGVLIYDENGSGTGPRYTYRGNFFQGELVCRVFEDPCGHALLAKHQYIPPSIFNTIYAVDAHGNQALLGGVPYVLWGLAPFDGGYLTTDLIYVDRFGPNFEFLGSLGSIGGRVVALDDGRAAAERHNGDVSIIGPPGQVEKTLTLSSRAWIRGASPGGLVYTARMELLDPDTGEVFAVSNTPGHPFPGWQQGTGLDYWVSSPTFSSTPQSSTRSCTANPNSTGETARAHVLGSRDSSRASLSLIATRMPPNTIAVPIFGTGAFDAPFGGGRLCVSPMHPSLTRGPALTVSAQGSAQVDFDFATPGLGAAFGPGTTWFHQVLYRDAGGTTGLNATDAVSVALR